MFFDPSATRWLFVDLHLECLPLDLYGPIKDSNNAFTELCQKSSAAFAVYLHQSKWNLVQSSLRSRFAPAPKVVEEETVMKADDAEDSSEISAGFDERSFFRRYPWDYDFTGGPRFFNNTWHHWFFDPSISNWALIDLKFESLPFDLYGPLQGRECALAELLSKSRAAWANFVQERQLARRSRSHRRQQTSMDMDGLALKSHAIEGTALTEDLGALAGDFCTVSQGTVQPEDISRLVDEDEMALQTTTVESPSLSAGMLAVTDQPYEVIAASPPPITFGEPPSASFLGPSTPVGLHSLPPPTSLRSPPRTRSPSFRRRARRRRLREILSKQQSVSSPGRQSCPDTQGWSPMASSSAPDTLPYGGFVHPSRLKRKKSIGSASRIATPRRLHYSNMDECSPVDPLPMAPHLSPTTASCPFRMGWRWVASDELVYSPLSGWQEASVWRLVWDWCHYDPLPFPAPCSPSFFAPYAPSLIPTPLHCSPCPPPSPTPISTPTPTPPCRAPSPQLIVKLCPPPDLIPIYSQF